MDVEKCTSIFELFTAFNFTYAVLAESNNKLTIDSESISFVGVIDAKLLKPITDFFQGSEDLLQNMITYRNSASVILSLDSKLVKDDSLVTTVNGDNTDLLSRLNQIISDCKDWVDTIGKNKQICKNRINSVFPFISYCMAVFCIAVLGISISDSNTVKYFTLFLLLLFTIIIYWIILKGQIENDYFNLTKAFLLFFLVVTVSHFLLNQFLPSSFGHFESQHPGEQMDYGYIYNFIYFFSNNNVKTILILVSVVLPFLHFIYYFFSMKSEYASIKKEFFRSHETSARSFEKIKNDIDDFANRNI